MINQILPHHLCLIFFNQFKQDNYREGKILTVAKSHYGTHDHHLSTFLFFFNIPTSLNLKTNDIKTPNESRI